MPLTKPAKSFYNTDFNSVASHENYHLNCDQFDSNSSRLWNHISFVSILKKHIFSHRWYNIQLLGKSAPSSSIVLKTRSSHAANFKPIACKAIVQCKKAHLLLQYQLSGRFTFPTQQSCIAHLQLSTNRPKHDEAEKGFFQPDVLPSKSVDNVSFNSHNKKANPGYTGTAIALIATMSQYFYHEATLNLSQDLNSDMVRFGDVTYLRPRPQH